MFNDKKIIAIIPARKGSKGIKDKNLRKINNLSLVEHSIISAKKSKYIDDILISTDSKKILSFSDKYNILMNELRTTNLSQDNSKLNDVIKFEIQRNNLKKLNYEILILLQPTSPLRTHLQIDHALEMFFNEDFRSLASVCKVEKNPIFTRRLVNNKLQKIIRGDSNLRRQDTLDFYNLNGAIYINYICDINDNFPGFNENEGPFVMDRVSSIDIDDYDDLLLARKIFKKRGTMK